MLITQPLKIFEHIKKKTTKKESKVWVNNLFSTLNGSYERYTWGVEIEVMIQPNYGAKLQTPEYKRLI